MPGHYRIGEVACLTGVTVETLRYYERRGLLPEPPRTEGGFRCYPPDVVSQVRFIKQAQALGLSLEDVQHLSPGPRHRSPAGCHRVSQLLQRRIVDVDNRLVQLRALRKTLASHLAACDHALRETTEPECPTLRTLARVRA